MEGEGWTICARLEHGSTDSVDQDVCYLVKGNLPSAKQFETFVRDHKEEDVNAAWVNEDGRIVDCMRGLPSETHNALLVTVPLRGGSIPVHFLSPIPQRRNAQEKLIETMQKLVILIRRSEVYRERAIACLKSCQVHESHALLMQVDFSQTQLDVDALKQTAFMVAQTIGLLMSNHEMYTKAALAEFFPDLKDLLWRVKGASTAPLTAAVKKMLECVGGTLKQHQSFVLFVPSPHSKHFMSVLQHEKNRVRVLVHATSSDAAYIRVSDALIVSREAPHWKVDASIRKSCLEIGVYDVAGKRIP